MQHFSIEKDLNWLSPELQELFSLATTKTQASERQEIYGKIAELRVKKWN